MIRQGDKVKIIRNPYEKKHQFCGEVGEIIHRSDDGKTFIIRFPNLKKDWTFSRECISKIEEA